MKSRDMSRARLSAVASRDPAAFGTPRRTRATINCEKTPPCVRASGFGVHLQFLSDVLIHVQTQRGVSKQPHVAFSAAQLTQRSDSGRRRRPCRWGFDYHALVFIVEG
jgi:hypothetical protein